MAAQKEPCRPHLYQGTEISPPKKGDQWPSGLLLGATRWGILGHRPEETSHEGNLGGPSGGGIFRNIEVRRSFLLEAGNPL